jgi:hypothetical protein
VKTHDLARALETLARGLRAAPNMPIEDVSFPFGHPRRRPEPSEIPMALSTLVALADIEKSQWIDFIRANGFPIDIRPRDASRDVVGKLLRYLEQTPEARKRITNVAERTRSQTSPELQKALDFLLKT